MKHLCYLGILFIVLNYTDKNVLARDDRNNKYETKKQNFYASDLAKPKNASNECETWIIFDLSKNVVSKNVFDISIKSFLKQILQYCNQFKYVVMDDNSNVECENLTDCNTTVKDCDGSNGCDLENMDYNSMTSSYPNELINDNVNDTQSFSNFLFKILSKDCQCAVNPVILLTNRIVSFNDSTAFKNIIENSCIKLTTILIGRNEESAKELLENEYKNISNAKSLNLLNYDCLNYLFYCFLPCSSYTPECLSGDIDDCQLPSKLTPNSNLEETLHIWYVIGLNAGNDFGQNFTKHIDAAREGLEVYLNSTGITQFRAKFITSSWPNTSVYFEDVDQIHSGSITTWGVLPPGDVIIDNEENFNKKLSIIPWSRTLNQARIGIQAIVIFTNYATLSLKTVINGQHLEGSMYVFNPVSYNNYSQILHNSTNFHLIPFNNDDPLFVYPLQTEEKPSNTSTTTMPSSSAKTSMSTSTTATSPKLASTTKSTSTALGKSTTLPSTSTKTAATTVPDISPAIYSVWILWWIAAYYFFLF